MKKKKECSKTRTELAADYSTRSSRAQDLNQAKSKSRGLGR